MKYRKGLGKLSFRYNKKLRELKPARDAHSCLDLVQDARLILDSEEI